MVGGAHGVHGATAASPVALEYSSVRENVIHQCKLFYNGDSEMLCKG